MTAQPIAPTPPQTDDPFGSGGAPSVSFANAPIGTSYTLAVVEAPTFVQARNFDTGQPEFWPDGNPKWTVVTGVVDQATGERRSLWAPKPSSLFAAIGAAQVAAGQQVQPGGVLTVTLIGEEPNKNPRLNPVKQYAASYTPPNMFGGETDPWGQAAQAAVGHQPPVAQHAPPAQPYAQQPYAQPDAAPYAGAPYVPPQQPYQPPVQQQQAPPPQQTMIGQPPVAQQPPYQPPAAPPGPGQPTAEQVAAMRVTGMTDEQIRGIFPAFTGHPS